MPLGFTSIFPVGLGAFDLDGLEMIPEFPAQFSPLAGSIDITEKDSYRAMQLGDGYEHRQGDDVAGVLQVASMSFICSELQDLDILTGFLRSVGGSKAFRASVPGAEAEYWYRDQYKKKHIHNRHWQVDVTFSETRVP